MIKGSSGKTKGTFGVVKDAEGILKLNLVMEGGSLEYEYTLSEDHTVLELCSPGRTRYTGGQKHRIYDIIAFIECPFCGRDRFEKKE